MIDFDEIPDDVLFARGKYSTLNAALADESRKLQALASALMGSASAIMKFGQAGQLESALYEISEVAQAIQSMRTICEEIGNLQHGKSELKSLAWPAK